MSDRILHDLDLNTFLELVDSAEEITQTGMWVLDLVDNHVQWSKGVYRIHELSEEKKIDFESAVSYYTKESFVAIQEAIGKVTLTGEISDGEYKMITAKGKHIDVRVIVKPFLENGKAVKLHGTITDITERKKAELARERARILAEEMTAMKTNFLATMSHEIRTPLNGIMGTAELMEHEVVDDNVRELISIQRESATRLMDTLNSILALTKLEAENPNNNLEEVEVKPILSKTFSLYEAKAKLKSLDLSLTCSSKSKVKVNPTMLSQCINNLVDNALKFTDSGSISISCFDENEMVKIDISDTGIGISEALQEQIFEPFWQVQMGQARKYQGTGLGLSIVKRYIEFVGGRVSVCSQEGKGSTFTVALPAIQA